MSSLPVFALQLFSADLWKFVANEWLDDIHGLCSLDKSICNHNLREKYLSSMNGILISRLSFAFENPEDARHCADWLISRKVIVRSLVNFQPLEDPDWLQIYSYFMPLTPTIESIEVRGICKMREEYQEQYLASLESFFRSCKKLTKFTTQLQYVNVTITRYESVLLSFLNQHTHLRCLDLKLQLHSDCIKVENLLQLHFQRLTSLHISNCTFSDIDMVRIVEYLPYLQDLVILLTEDAEIMSLGYIHQWSKLPKFDHLTSLHVTREVNDSDDVSSAFPLYILYRAPNLQKLGICGGHFVPISLKKLPKLCPNLVSIHLHLEFHPIDPDYEAYTVEDETDDIDAKETAEHQNDKSRIENIVVLSARPWKGNELKTLPLKDIRLHHVNSDYLVRTFINKHSLVKLVLSCIPGYFVVCNRAFPPEICSFQNLQHIILHQCQLSSEFLKILWTSKELQIVELRNFTINEVNWIEVMETLLAKQKDNRLPKLQKFTIQPLYEVMNIQLVQLLVEWICTCTVYIRELRIYHVHLEDTMIDRILHSLPMLVHLSIDGKTSMISLEPTIIEERDHHISHLRSFSLHHNHTITPQQLHNFCQRFPQLRTVGIFNCRNFSSRDPSIQRFILQQSTDYQRDICVA